MEQVIAPNLVDYRRGRNIPFFIMILLFLPMLFIRMHTFPIIPGKLNLAIGEPLFFICMTLLLLDKWNLNKILNTPFTKYWAIFFFYGTWNLIMSIKYYKNGLGFALGVYLNLCIYPLSYFLGYHYFKTTKHLKNYYYIVTTLVILFTPLAAFYLEFHIGDKAAYFQFFDHYEAWAISYLVFIALSRYFIYKKMSWADKIFAFMAGLIIIICNRRGIWISTFMSSFVAYYVSVKTFSFSYLLRIFSYIALFVGGFFLMTRIAPDNFIIKSVDDRVEQTIQNFENPTEFGDNTIAWRLLIYAASIKVFAEHPILGKGIGFQPTVVFPKGTDLYNEREGVAFHDLIVAFLTTMGVVGLILYFVLHLNFIFKILRDKNVLPPERRPYIVAMFCQYLSACIWSIASNDLWSNADLVIIAFLLMGAVSQQLVQGKLAAYAKETATQKPEINTQELVTV